MRQKSEIKGIQIENGEIKLSLFADDIIVYVENHKNLSKHTNINCVSICQLETEMKKSNLKALKKQKYLGINLRRHIQNLCNENYTVLMKLNNI